MNRLLLLLTVVFCLAFNCQISAQNETYKSLKSVFQNPPSTARPKVYWWCLNGNIDTLSAKQELSDMKKVGISGFDLFEIGVHKQDTMIPGGPAFLSDASLKIIKFVVKEAGKLDLEVGLNVSSSWNAGGTWTLPENAGKSLYYAKTTIKGESKVQKINLPFPEISFPKASIIGSTGKAMIPFQANGRPVYYKEVVVLAIPSNTANNMLDTAKIINITSFFDPEKDLLTWKVPLGDWEIHRYVCSNSGQQLVLPSPHSSGLTIDHFDSTAVRTHLMYIINRLKPVLGDFRNTALKSFYLASYEVRGIVWTSTLPNEFKKVNGYDIYKFLPSLFSQELFNQAITKRVQTDFKKTLSELLINNLYVNSQKICNRYGLKINCEAGGPGYPLYNGPAEPLKALGALDIPRGEFWINHSRYYMDSNGKDSIDILQVVKEVAAASHIYEKQIVEEESFTSFQQWQEGPFDMKPFGDRAFCEGMNRVVFHGFSHSPTGTGYPGFVYHAGTHFNNKRVWWPKIKPFVDYLSRVSYVLQETKFVSDVLYYYGDRVPNSATPKNTHFMVGPGYDYEVINTEILLNKVAVKNGKLVLSNGACFSLLALEYEDERNPAVLTKLNELVKQGAIIVGERPETGLKPLDMLKTLDVAPDFSYADKEAFLLDFIHYQKQDMDFYFIRNTTDQWISRECSFRQQLKIPEIWNPVTGEIVPITIYTQEEKTIKIPITLAPYGSYFVVFDKRNPAVHYTSISASGVNPPLMDFTRDGIIFLNEGVFKLNTDSGSKQIENKMNIQVIDGAWKVTFSKGWGAPDSIVFPELTSWTNNKNTGVKYYSGIGTYQKSFNYKKSSGPLNDKRIFIDLGNLSKVAELWLNGQSLGIVWAKPFKYDVTKYIKNGKNKITIEVANTWSNRLTGDAITGEKYTNTNITSTNIPGNSKIYFPWAKVPLIESGLLGPVTIQTINIVK